MASMKPTAKLPGKKAAIIGGGPTGIAAAYFLGRAGVACTIFERTGKLGGIVPITVAAVIVTGIMGAVLAPLLIRLFRVKDPVEAGVAIGTCSHALGTTKALELGEVQGAMSGIAIGVAGIITVLISMFL